jgi:hypothetical protein
MILSFIFRGSIPLLKYPFIIIYAILVLYSILDFNELRKTSGPLKIWKTYSLILIQVVLYIYAIFNTEKIYLSVTKDFFNILFIFSFYFFLSIFISNLEELKSFLKKLNVLIIILSIIISLYGIGNIFYLFSGDNLSLNIDYNFAILPIIFGMIGLVFYILDRKNTVNGFLYGAILLLFSVAVLLSGSRRGLIVFSLLIVCLIVSQVIAISNRKSFFLKLRTTFAVFSISFVSLLILCFFLIKDTPSSFKNRSLLKIGSKNPRDAKIKITTNMMRYIIAFDRKTSFDDFYNYIWTPSFDPKDPESGWGYRIHKTIYPLPGSNIDIVPRGSMGYQLDSTSAPNSWSGNAYSYTKSCSAAIADTATVDASVYCYASKDFNGDWIRIVLSPDNLSWIGSASYDLGNKGQWQKLQTVKFCNEKEVSLYLYVCKNGVESFKSLTGYVIFAYPQCTTLYNTNPDSKAHLSHIQFNSDINDIKIKNNGLITYPSRNEMASLLPSIQLSSLITSNNIDKDPIRKWISKLISEDTTYYGYHSKTDIVTTFNPFIDQRRERWQFAWQIYTREYNWSQRIFGGGFNFLNWYGYYFYRDKTRSDYPHNPFLHILLYSGIVGFLFYFLLVFNAFRYYLKYLKDYYLLFVFFVIAYFFTFFSGGNPFDPPITGFFIIMPFFINAIHRKVVSNEKQEPK